MNEQTFSSNDLLEPERYELYEEPFYSFTCNRRDFLKSLGGGILVITFLEVSSAEEIEKERRRAAGKRNPPQVGAWLHIGKNGLVTAFTGKVEMGQNIRTELSQIVAEDLHTPLDSIRMVMGDTDLVPYDRGTFGSLTTHTMGVQLRKASAAMREILIDLAAERFKVDRSLLQASHGSVSHKKTRQSVSFGALTRGQEIWKEITEDVPTAPPGEWKIAGTSVPKVNARTFVTGEHSFASDIRLPGMVYGKILRPPAFKARLVSCNLDQAKAMKGVTVVHDGDFIGVTAPDVPTAEKAVSSIQTQWETPPQPSNQILFEHLKKNASSSGGGRRSSPYKIGSLQEGLSKAKQVLEQTYTVAYIAHTPLEPRAAVAQWEHGKLTVWTGTQRPFGVQEQLMRTFDLPPERVRVIMPDCGSGYGGKHTGEAALEAARLAKEAHQPVKVTWTREEEFTWAYFRPAGVIDIKAGVDSEGILTAWEFHNYNSGSSSIRPPYDIPHQHIQFHRTDSPLRQGSYRCLAATANNFARESFMDELAHAAKIDPLEFRLKNLKDERFRTVLQKAAERFGWGQHPSTPTRGFGLAAGFEKNGYVATCVEVAIDRSSGKVTVVRVVESFDCGPVLNPNHLTNQIEGMIMMGMGGALFEAIEFADGKILNPRLSQYKVPRFRDLPQIETVLIDRKDIPSAGAGEAPIIGIAPAIGNAIFQATGVRLRAMPMVPRGFKEG